MTLTLVWRGTDPHGNTLPEPAGWQPGPYVVEHVPRSGTVIDVCGVSVYAIGCRHHLAPNAPMATELMVVPVP